MPRFVTSGITLRRIAYGDHDVILTLFSKDRGKMAVIAKSAKKSRKRFSGLLELFSELSVTCHRSRRGGMPVLQEASLVQPFANIRGDIQRTATASYWVELVNDWLQDHECQTGLYELLMFALSRLDAGLRPPMEISILFQMRFLELSGMGPGIDACHRCQRDVDSLKGSALGFNLARGSVICDACRQNGEPHLPIASGTLKLLRWVRSGSLETAARIRCDAATRTQGLSLLEAFIPYHLGKEPKSLGFLKQMRTSR
jgi:DNA repair protein RecO (recombination protein O)